MNDPQVMVKIIKWMISEASNKDYIEILETMLLGVENKTHIEEEKHPRYLSIVLLGTNLFPLKMQEYRRIAEIL